MLKDPSAPPSAAAFALYESTDEQRFELMRNNPMPPAEDLAGWEFNGTNVGPLQGLIGIRKFRKGFYLGPERATGGPRSELHGFNIPVRQTGVEGRYHAKPSDENPKRFGFYRVYSAALNPRYNRFPQAWLLDYGLGGNGLAVEALLRDYLVQANPGSSDLLLGWACFHGGLAAIPGGFFVLERARPHSFQGA